ncbi:alpha/beta fold hydrolase [Amaricoccus sp.]|uniref:alpha/beta fold hydrolase n=1 Tax=Amaricoccus sp. TaxID=1872485 RepID=UPI001B600E8F|nr:alpha/beta fold hydrolase [Amaricoccus sp.]MBP7000959.1 alpha/beta fold hydrolase [Amaricoccus sp.]
MNRLKLAFLAVALLGLAACAAPPTADPHVTLRSWPARGETRAAILALHGFGDTGATAWEGAARDWAARGIAVYAPDQRGFGANPSWRRWPGPEALVSDAVQLSRIVRARNPGVPLVVVGHSMGGGVALAAAAQGLDADAIVLAGPAIAGGDALNPVLRAGAWAIATVAPEKRWTGDGVVEISPTDNLDAIRRALADPRFFGDPSSRELWGLVRIMDMAAAAAPEVETPTLTLMGAHDEILRPDRVESVHDRIPAAAGWRLYPEGWHWLFRDLHGKVVRDDVADFVLGLPAARLRAPHCTTPACPAGSTGP